VKRADLERPNPSARDRQRQGQTGTTKLVHIVLGPPQVIQDRVRMELLLSHAAERLAHQHQLVAREVVFPDGLGDDALRVAVGVDVGRVPLDRPVCQHLSFQLRQRDTDRVDSAVIRGLQQRQRSLRPDHPVRPFRAPNAHAPDNRHGHAQAAVSQAAVVDFCFG
jgi:hypothetical protein